MVAIENSIPSGKARKGKTRKDGHVETVLAKIDNYELVRELGGGGFGTVYLAKDTVSGVEYAVKGLPPFVKNNREELENIKANFALVSRLSHTNIARAHVLHLAREVGYSSEDVRQKLRVDSGDTLMVMEFAPGVTLSQWRKQFPDRKVPLAQALEITRQIASALDYAHEQKILHRDIKPENVMIETKPDGRVIARVLDFGLAAEIRSSMGRVSREIHDTSGTRPYMAPEQWLGGKQGPATDQYALAVLFHELMTGDVPFASAFDTGDPMVMMNVIGREPFVASADLPKPIRFALEKALAKKPEDRFASCAEFVAALLGKEFRNVRLGKRGLIIFALTLFGIGGVFWGMQTQDHTAIAPSASVSPANPLVVTNEIVRTTTNADVRPPQSEQELVTSKVQEERKPSQNDGSTGSIRGLKTGDTKVLSLPGGVRMEMIYCGPGKFTMGSPENEKGRCHDDEPLHDVTISQGFWLGKYEVTQAQWVSLMDENPSAVSGNNLPVCNVSWNDCQRFIKRVNLTLNCKARLPTEKEWEYACRAGTVSAYGGTGVLDDMGWHGGNDIKHVVEVGQKKPNAWGFFDMHGNVWEWCEDVYREAVAKVSHRVLRGGCWFTGFRCCRSASRGGEAPERDPTESFSRYHGCGFRLCCSEGQE